MPSTTSPTELTLYSAVACNYSQRTRIALALKGTKFDLVEVDLLNRPAAFMATPSRGAVPALQWDGGFVYGSSTLNEFIEEQWPDPPLLPDDILERAAARSWVSLNHDKISRPFEAALMVVDDTETERVLREFDALLVDLDLRLRDHWTDHEGPYWHGETMGLVDVTYAPLFARFCGLEQFHGWSLAAELDVLAAWIATLTSDLVVLETRGPEDELLAILEGYRENYRRVAAQR
jgi:glutathione S-transferase